MIFVSTIFASGAALPGETTTMEPVRTADDFRKERREVFMVNGREYDLSESIARSLFIDLAFLHLQLRLLQVQRHVFLQGDWVVPPQ